MNRTILYYPTIELPRSSWLMHALLYWDEVSSIIPDTRRVYNSLSGRINYLIDEGQFRPIRPEELFKKDWQIVDQFINEFKETVLSEDFQRFIIRQHRVFSPRHIHANKLGENHTAKIHNNKTTDVLFNFLEENGLASRMPGDWEWLNMERNTALLYMSLLAKHLAEVDSNQTTISTDIPAYANFNFKKVKRAEGAPAITINLNGLLPTPKIGVTIEQVVEFKRKRKDNLLHFKKYISDFQTKVSKAKSDAEIKDATITFQEGIQIGVTDLSKVLSDSKIEHSLKTLKSLVTLKSPTALAAIGTAINDQFNILKIPSNLSIAGVLTVGAIELTANFIEHRNKMNIKRRESPFSYIYQAQCFGIVEKFR